MFIENAKKIHGSKYDYSKVIYENRKTRVTISCPEHGDFEQTPDSHLRGSGCPKCAAAKIKEAAKNFSPPQLHNESTRWDTSRFIKEAKAVHGSKYDYSKVRYINTHTKVTIVCPKHGEFEQKPNAHVNNRRGCRKCSHDLFSANLSMDNNSFIVKAKKLHGDKYDYSKVQYVDTYAKVTIVCLEHGEFEQSPTHHLQGMGCSKCNSVSSNQEQIVKNWLIEAGVEFTEKDRRVISPLELDFYLPKYRIAIEVNGLRWHSEQFVPSGYHHQKHVKCSEAGVRLIHIYEDELRSTDKVRSYLRSQLGLAPRLYARKCEAREVSARECNEFLNKWHLLGETATKIRVGLWFNEELVGIMCFNSIVSHRGVSRTNCDYELVRACFSYAVIGGSAKLLAHFVSNYNPNTIITYSDNDKFTGAGYEKLGFKFVGKVAPDYKTIWRVGQLDYRRSKQYSRKSSLCKVLPNFNAALTEHQNCLNNKVYRIYDSGKKRWLWSNKNS